MKKLFLLFLLCGVFFSGCDNLKSKDSSSTKKKKIPLEEEEEEPVIKKKKPAPEALTTNSNGKIMNDVIVHENGLQVSKAYLSREDGTLIEDKNEAALNEGIYLHLVIDKGWTVKDGNVSLGASEKIVTDAGELVLNAEDVFADNPMVTEAKAEQILLKAGITKTRASINYFVVHYRLWDKESDNEVKGSYKLYITSGEKNDVE